MYEVKRLPEDFVVEEITEEYGNEGDHLILKVTKREMNTEDVAQLLARALKIPRKAIGYAGAKDKYAVTTQYFSVTGHDESRVAALSLPENVTVKVVGRSKAPITLGGLEENRFTIAVRNLERHDCLELGMRSSTIPNYFGEQRFGSENIVIGRALVKKNFEAAALLIAKGDRDVYDRLCASPTDFVGALNAVPRHTIMLYLHAYQSWIWNETLAELIRRKLPKERLKAVFTGNGQMVFDRENKTMQLPPRIPLVGFGTEIHDRAVNEIVVKQLADEDITTRDFIIRQLRGLSPEGGNRKSTIIVNVTVKEVADELNKGRMKQILEFTLPKGSYATIVVEALYGRTRDRILRDAAM